ncbi:MAG: PAS domain-containing protein [Pseudomonadota bacterium]
MAFATASMHEMALESVPIALVLTNPALEDNPIVFVNRAFTTLTGYTADMCIGRNCRFLQGVDTDPSALARLREGLAAVRNFSVELLNYRADGTPFLNQIYIAPLHDDAGALQFFIGLQRPVEARAGVDGGAVDTALREIHHRVKNHLSMVVGMIRMQARVENANSLENYATLARRIETLQLLYQEMTTGGTERPDDEDIALGAYVSRIASTIAYLDGRESVRLNLDMANVRAPIDAAAQVGLLVSELLTNAYQHAFEAREEGLVEVRLQQLSDQSLRLQVSDDGRGLPHGSRWPDAGNLGGKIVRSLLTGLSATLSTGGGRSGCVFTVDVPAERIAAGADERVRARA